MEEERKNLMMMEKCNNYNKWIADTIKEHVSGKVIEFGVGDGSVAKYFFNQSYHGVDIDKEHVKRCRKVFGISKNFHCFDATCGSAKFTGKFDTVLMVNFLEHVFADGVVVNNAWRMLKKGGRLVILAPAHQWNFGVVDEADGHYRRYSKEMLINLLKDNFIIERIKEQNFFGALGWYYQGKVFPSKIHRSGELGLFDKLVPFFRWYEERFRIPFGLSILIVGEKL